MHVLDDIRVIQCGPLPSRITNQYRIKECLTNDLNDFIRVLDIVLYISVMVYSELSVTLMLEMFSPIE